MRHSEDWWANHAPGHVLRCTAKLKRDGSRCRREAIPGGNICTQHGGLAPAAQAAAAVKIRMSVLDAVEQLHEMLKDPAVAPREKITILHDLLNRGGLSATSKHLISVEPEDPLDQLIRGILSDPEGLDRTPRVEIEQTTRPAPAAIDAAAEAHQTPFGWYGDAEGIVDAELVEEVVVVDLPGSASRSEPEPDPAAAPAATADAEPPDPYTVQLVGSLSDRMPRPLREGIKVLERARLW